ncbi:hypothetical protein [Pseudomonas helleri]|uniref:hypothetical protein n=1 Tax=Pseudomonas helleri TaxID=1608996 RepID=UPI003FD5D1BC
MVPTQGRVSGLTPPSICPPACKTLPVPATLKKSCFQTRRRTDESCVFDCTTTGARTKKSAIDKTPQTELKALLHMACALFIRSYLFTNSTLRNEPFTFRKHGHTPIAIGVGDFKRSHEWPVASAMVLHFFAKLCTK